MLFDLDGVLTTTRAVHAAAWKQTFDQFLADWDEQRGSKSTLFDDRADYAAYVDGKPRQDGVRDFLASRGIELPEGQPDSSEDDRVTYRLRSGNPVTAWHYGQEFTVLEGSPVSFAAHYQTRDGLAPSPEGQ